MKKTGRKRAGSGSAIRLCVRGGGGCGKSYTLNCFRKWLRETGREKEVVFLGPSESGGIFAARMSDLWSLWWFSETVRLGSFSPWARLVDHPFLGNRLLVGIAWMAV